MMLWHPSTILVVYDGALLLLFHVDAPILVSKVDPRGHYPWP